ncbi:hypothetical protein [Paraburkholderia sp. 35.1]|uniref:hypothetical protein n=1 Tax=Paraburkholderia sp. 35.1 TaxID=2991058 RepID=UPI003D261BC4
MPSSLFDLTDKVAIVTGSSRGIGYASALGIRHPLLCGGLGPRVSHARYVAAVVNAGGEIYKTKDALVREKLELVWYTWATRYKDGSIDFGHFTLGNDMFGFAILGNEKGEVRFTYDVTGTIDFGANGYWQERLRYSAFGEEWAFMPDPRGRLVGLGTLRNPQVDGRWRRVGDAREPDVWFAWGEAAPEHGSRPINRLPGLGTRVGVNFRKY